jgi:CHASE3 domain sensor protein
MAWIATRAKVDNEIAKLRDALSSAYQGHGAAEHLDKTFQTRVEAMLSVLDHSLAEKLDEVSKATDPGQRTQLVQQARQIMQRYETYVANEPLIAKLDANPFVPISIQKTLTATLAALSSALRGPGMQQ